MHELSISAAMLRQVADVMALHGAAGVAKITLKLGPLCGVEPVLLQAAYKRMRADTVIACADLNIIDVPVRVFCEECVAESEAAPNRLACPACGSCGTRLVSGDEMLIEAVDLIF